MAVRKEKILPSIVVEVEKAHAEADVLSIDAEASLDADVLEGTIPVVPVQRGHLFGEIRADNVQPTICVEIPHRDAHSGQSNAIFIQRATRRNGDFAEGSVVIIAIEQTWRAIARNVNVRPSVVVEVRGRRSHAIGTGGLPISANKDH